MQSYKLSPSDFAFLWEECPRCYYLKVKRGIQRPRSPMAAIYKHAEGAIVKRLTLSDISWVVLGAPKGKLIAGERWVKSDIIRPPGCAASCFISGKPDLLVELDGGGFAVPDVKMAHVKDPYLEKYGRQLHSYAYALEHPQRGALSVSPVRRLGLIVFEPGGVPLTVPRPGSGLLEGLVNWVEIKRDVNAFMNFLGEVVTLLEKPEPPDSSPDCEWCAYRGSGSLAA